MTIQSIEVSTVVSYFIQKILVEGKFYELVNVGRIFFTAVHTFEIRRILKLAVANENGS